MVYRYTGFKKIIYAKIVLCFLVLELLNLQLKKMHNSQFFLCDGN